MLTFSFAQRVDWKAIYNFTANPKYEDHPKNSKAHDLLQSFASNYTDMLADLHDVFNGHPEKYGCHSPILYFDDHQRPFCAGSYSQIRGHSPDI